MKLLVKATIIVVAAALMLILTGRKFIAAQFRSEGEGRSAEILGAMEKELHSVMLLTTNSDFYQYVKQAIPAEALGLPAPVFQEAAP